MPKRPSTRRTFFVGFALVLLILATILFVTWKSAEIFLNTSALVAQSRETLELGEKAMRHIMEMESARRGYLITDSETLIREYDKARADLADAFHSLKEKTADRPDQSVRIDRMNLLVSRIIEIGKLEIETRRAGSLQEGAALFEESNINEIMSELHTVHFDFEHVERVLLVERQELAENYGLIGSAVMIAGPAITFLALGGAGILILRDVGRRQRAEETLAQQANLLSNIMDAMPDHVFVKDREGRYIMHNRAHRLYLGLRASESIEGRTVFDFFPRALAERYHADDVYVIETGAPIRNREEPARPTSPNVVWLATTKMPLRDPGGHVIGVVCVSSDITARKEADEKLKRFAEKLERSNAELDSFASVASHDLQEPLRKIQAFGDRLRTKCGDELGEQGRDYLARMQNASERMQVLIQDLLKLSRIASRAKPFIRCKLGNVVADVLSDLEVAIEDKHARIEVGELPAIDADPLQMRQLFQNLLTNALKFQKPGETQVIAITSEIAVAVGNEIPGALRGSDICRISVHDNGIGFEQKFADQIFVVFQRLRHRARCLPENYR
jgi:PAS domain S-box-containing protein